MPTARKTAATPPSEPVDATAAPEGTSTPPVTPEAATAPPSIVQALTEVRRLVGHVGKGETASMGRGGTFQFRGIDAVVNAVAGPMAAVGVLVLPRVLNMDRQVVTTNSGQQMMNVVVTTQFSFHGPAGDSLSVTTYGEAADSGDKAASKAQSVALRVALLQALMLPTDEPDPDLTHYERATPPPVQQNVPQGPKVWPAPDPEARPKAASAWQAIQVLDDGQAEQVRAAYPQGWPHPTALNEDQADRLLTIMRNLLTDAQDQGAPDPT